MSPKSSDPEPEAIRRAAALIREGKLVAFPTETVYGLGANALDEAAVRRIFEVKGRPGTSPLIVHVASSEQARSFVSEWPAAAETLAERFWPGPLTLVLPKKPAIPDVVTAGLPTVGIRVPDHRVALELIRQAGVPIAAPSANPFTELSPTRAGHLRPKLLDQVDCVLDAGGTPVGIESTVLSLAVTPPVLLRPGVISRAELESLIGSVSEDVSFDKAHPSPGLHPRHYAPRTPLVLVKNGRLPTSGKGAYIWRVEPAPAARAIQMPLDARAYAARIYSTLHELDDERWDWIAVEELPDDPEWNGVRDRLERAAKR